MNAFFFATHAKYEWYFPKGPENSVRHNKCLTRFVLDLLVGVRKPLHDYTVKRVKVSDCKGVRVFADLINNTAKLFSISMRAAILE